jgi:hypothetical protein
VKVEKVVADPLYLSLWFNHAELVEILPRGLGVMRQFPFSTKAGGIGYLAIHPVSWGEATVLEQRFNPGLPPEHAVLVASDLLHEDYAYVFEGAWDLWMRQEEEWVLRPSVVKFIVHGENFEEGIAEQEGQIQVDFGFDAPFLQEDEPLSREGEQKIRANLKKLVEFAIKAEKASGSSRRLMWSESEDADLAQKLIARLQNVQ